MNKYMLEAIKQAKIAQNKGNIPVGAVIVMNNKIISKAYNNPSTIIPSLCSPPYHHHK